MGWEGLVGNVLAGLDLLLIDWSDNGALISSCLWMDDKAELSLTAYMGEDVPKQDECGSEPRAWAEGWWGIMANLSGSLRAAPP